MKNINRRIYIIIQHYSSLNILYPKKWPIYENGEVEDIQFEDDKVRHLCRQFQLKNENDIIRAFRTYKMEVGKEVFRMT